MAADGISCSRRNAWGRGSDVRKKETGGKADRFVLAADGGCGRLGRPAGDAAGGEGDRGGGPDPAGAGGAGLLRGLLQDLFQFLCVPIFLLHRTYNQPPFYCQIVKFPRIFDLQPLLPRVLTWHRHA